MPEAVYSVVTVAGLTGVNCGHELTVENVTSNTPVSGSERKE